MKSALAICLTIFVGLSQGVFGAPIIIDQSQTDFSSGEFVYGTVSVAQTFTPSVTGSLAQLDLFLSDNNPSDAKTLVVSIYDTLGGVPKNPLGTMDLNNISGDYFWYSLNFATLNISLNANTLYAFVLSSPDSFESSIYPGGSVNSNSYTRGMALIQGDLGQPWQPDTRAPQLMFQTYMNVPEPRAAVMLLFAGGLLGARSLRRARFSFGR
jgi:hypothetical protein